MTTAFRCPHCRGIVDADDSTAGQKARCPHCGGGVKYPPLVQVRGELLPPPAPPPPAPQQLVFVAPQPESRLGSPGWISRAFSSTIGIVLGLLAIPALLAFSIFVATAGFMAWSSSPDESPVPGAAEQALRSLRQFNITSLDDKTATQRNGAIVTLIGHGLDTRGTLHRVAVRWSVADFGERRQWQIEHILVDDKTVFVREERSEVSNAELDR